MILTNSYEARELGNRLAALVLAGHITQAEKVLAPFLARRIKFDLLRKVGKPIGEGPIEFANAFLERITAGRTEGGWVVIGSILERQLDRDLPGALERCRKAICISETWYAADTLGEDVLGQALISNFHPTLEILTPWREDPSPWVRRAVGASIHHWAKHARGAAEQREKVRGLLAFLIPMFGEWEINAAKGVGWGLKTLGKYYPDLLTDWLENEVLPRQKHYRRLVLHKAMTYLPRES